MALLGEVGFALIGTGRTEFSGIFPDVTIREVPRDALIITEHPVERGAAIADHAFVRPTVLEMELGFSNSSAGVQGYADLIYAYLLKLQGVREPFPIYTARRAYQSMLLEGIVAPRDQASADALFVSLTFRQINIAYTQQTSASAGTPASDPAQQAMPQTTGSVANQGSLQSIPFSGGTDSFQGAFSTAGNTTFSEAPAGIGLAPSAANASFDVMYVDGQAFDTTGLGVATGSGVSPGSLSGNIGMFGQYRPGAFGRYS